MYIYIPRLFDLSPTPSLDPSRSSQVTELGFLCFIADSELPILHMGMYVCPS